MVQMRDDFLGSIGLINENQAEYSILSDMFNVCPGKVFMFELKDLQIIKDFFTNITQYINKNYKSFDFRKFCLSEKGELICETILEIAGSSLSDETIINYAIDFSVTNKSYVLVQTFNTLVLLYDGHFDDKFKGFFADRKKLLEMERKRKNIDELDWVFTDFQLERQNRGCGYVISRKISNEVSEQKLRNSLIEFLRQETNLHIVPELCTSKTHDEESVDIGVIDSNNRVAIIEVKYLVEKGCFEDEKKKAYTLDRFRDGYQQLDKYCIHLNEDNYILHSAYLYMFYAHTMTKEQVIESAKKYLKEHLDSKGGWSCSEKFLNHYKETVCDNMLEARRVCVNS